MNTALSLFKPPQVQLQRLSDDGRFPNSRLPLLIYTQAFEVSGESADYLETLLASNRWHGTWRNGIYNYHHYHGTAHEVLTVAAGSARVLFGGDDGWVQDLHAGDAVVIPAGVAHRNLASSRDFVIVGAYPRGQEYDMNYGNPDERPKADQNIARLPLPTTDPLYGPTGPLLGAWNR